MSENDTTSSSPAGETAGSASRLNRAKDFVSEKYASAADSVKTGYGAAREKVGEKYTQVREKVDEIDFQGMMDQTRSYVRSNPGKALLISVGIGFVIGLLLRRNDDDDD